MSHDSRDKFLLVDGHALIYRAFYAFPKQMVTKTGMLTNAIYGFSRILLTTIEYLEPTYMAVTFDHKDPTNRRKEFDFYKAHRKPMPEELRPQIEVIKDVVKALNIPIYVKSGFEADDLIGTINRTVEGLDEKLLTMILTGDKDMFQLVDNDTNVYLPGRGSRQDLEYNEARVLEKMGVRPDQIIDLKALMGDASDNIPGIKGIGPKTAVGLLSEHETLEKLYETFERVVKESGSDKEAMKTLGLKPGVFNKLAGGKEDAFISQKLATILIDVPLEFELESCLVKGYDKSKVAEVFEELDFKSLIQLLPKDEFEESVQDALF